MGRYSEVNDIKLLERVDKVLDELEELVINGGGGRSISKSNEGTQESMSNATDDDKVDRDDDDKVDRDDSGSVGTRLDKEDVVVETCATKPFWGNMTVRP